MLAMVVTADRPIREIGWQPGISGNPLGRVAGEVDLTGVLRALLRERAPRGPEGNERRHQIAQQLIDLALQSDDRATSLRAIQTIFERIEGKVKDTVELKGSSDLSVVVAYVAAKRLAEADPEPDDGTVIEGHATTLLPGAGDTDA